MLYRMPGRLLSCAADAHRLPRNAGVRATDPRGVQQGGRAGAGGCAARQALRTPRPLRASPASPCPVARRGCHGRAPTPWSEAISRGIRVEQPDKVKQGRLAAVLVSARPDVAVVAAY